MLAILLPLSDLASSVLFPAASAGARGAEAPLEAPPTRRLLQGAPYTAPSWRTLFLSSTSLPSHAIVRRLHAGNAAADRVDDVHTQTFAQLGRIGGVSEEVDWTANTVHSAASFKLRYVGSIFPDASLAAACRGDALASGWEAGTPIPGSGAEAPLFTVHRPHHQTEVETAAFVGPVEIDVSLRFAARTRRAAVAGALRRLGQVISAETSKLRNLLADAPPTAMLPQPTGATQSVPGTPWVSSPPIFLSPWGTGPVVKSPSLMVIDSSQSDEPSFDPGAFRSDIRPRIAKRASHHPDLTPSGALARFVRTAVVEGRSQVYDGAAIYPSASDAEVALEPLLATNDARAGLTLLNLEPYSFSLRYLQSADTVRGWRVGRETILALRIQNVVMTLAVMDETPDRAAFKANQLGGMVPSWLHAQGTQIVDAAGLLVTLNGLNWYGFEGQDFVAGGLDYRRYEDILQSIKLLGYTTIRLPYSDQLVEQNPLITAHVGANPELNGLHGLDIMDRIVNQAGALGLSVILDNHRSDAGWSAEENGLWYTPAYPDSAFIQDWVTMAHRYAVNDVVIGADLRNEPHGAATWGDGNPATDWQLAAERAGDAVLSQAPQLLVIVEGVQFYKDSGSYWWGGNLMGVASAPVVLHFLDGSSARSQLVYSAHEYGKDNCASGCPWFNSTTSYATLSQLWDRFWGYVAADPSQPYAAPVWIGEFGTCNYAVRCVTDDTPGSQGQWFSALTRYLAVHNFGWSYWSANGTQSTANGRTYGALDWYGLFAPDWSAPALSLETGLRGLQQAEATGETDTAGGPR